MPSSSVKQAKLMSAISHGWKPSGKAADIPVKVAKEFHAADASHKYGKKSKSALNTARKYSKRASGGKVKKYADAGSVDEDTTPAGLKKVYITGQNAPEVPNVPEQAGGAKTPAQFTPTGYPGMAEDLTRRTPIEGMEPPPPSLTEHHETPRDVIQNYLTGSETRSYEPRAVLARKAMGLLDWTPPMQALEAGQEAGKGNVAEAAAMMLPGAKMAKEAKAIPQAVLEYAAQYGMTGVPHPDVKAAEKAAAKALKAQYPKDIASQVIEQGYGPEQIDNLKQYMTPGTQAAFDKHYNKMQKSPWNTPEIQATKPPESKLVSKEDPNYISNYHENNNTDMDAIVSEIEKALGGIKQSPQNKPYGVSSKDFGTDAPSIAGLHWEPYETLHNELSQQSLNLTQPQRQAVGYWGTSDGYKDINGFLRGHVEGNSNNIEAIRQLDAAMVSSPLKEDTLLWRGIHGPQAEELRKLGEGHVFFNKGYTTTTVDPRRATHYGGKDDDGILLNYHMPAGSPSLYVSHPNAGNWIQSEREMLLPHNGKYEIIGIEKIKSPVWHYMGDVKDKTPREFTVYHVAPTDEGHAFQLDVGKSSPEPWQEKADNALKESEYKSNYNDDDIEEYYKQSNEHHDKSWEPSHIEYENNLIHESLDKHLNFVDWKNYKPLKADPIPKSFEENYNRIAQAGGNPDVALLKGGNFWKKKYPKETPDKSKEESSQTKGLFLTDENAVAGEYGIVGPPYAAIPKNEVAVIDFENFAKDIGTSSGAYSPEFVKMIKIIREKYDPEMLIAHNVHDWAAGGSRPGTQYIVFKTNILRAPHAEFDPKKWHLRLPLAGIAGLPAGAGIYSYGGKGEDNKFARGGKVEAEKALPENHQLGMKVPKGGSMCANCKFLSSPTTCGNKGFVEWNGGAELPEPSDEYCCDNYGYDKPEKKAKGGTVSKKEEDPKDHEFINFAKGGLIDSHIPGRTDKIPMKVPPGSYVLPADIPSALGQGNTKAGSEVLNKMFTHSAYGLKPMTQKAQKFHFDGFKKFKADGGETDHVPIIAAGGEYIIHPDVVKEVGHGDMKKGHAVLDKFVLHARKQHINTLKKLKPPKQ